MWQFQGDSIGTQSYIYMYSFSSKLPISCQITLNRVSHEIQYVLGLLLILNIAAVHVNSKLPIKKLRIFAHQTSGQWPGRKGNLVGLLHWREESMTQEEPTGASRLWKLIEKKGRSKKKKQDGRMSQIVWNHPPSQPIKYSTCSWNHKMLTETEILRKEWRSECSHQGLTQQGTRVAHMYVCVLVTQSCLALCNPVDGSLPGSAVHGILQARTLERLPCSPPGDLPDPGIETESHTLQADSLPSATREACIGA